MATIKVAPLPSKKIEFKSQIILAELCYYYPQYTYAQARRLPYKTVKLLMNTAYKEQARDYLILTQIAAAPKTKKFEGVKTLMNHFKEIVNG